MSDRWVDAPGWKVIEGNSTGNPRLDAKHPKLFPWQYVDGPLSIWVDASCEILDASFVRPEPDVIGAYPHPDRDCIYREAKAAGTWPNLEEQVAHYDHPEHAGLWATGILVWHHTPEARRLAAVWWEHLQRWSLRDQVSFPVACREIGVVPNDLPGDLWANPYVRWHR